MLRKIYLATCVGITSWRSRIVSLKNALFISQWVEMKTRHVVRECWKILDFSQWNIFPGRQWLSYGTIPQTKDV